MPRHMNQLNSTKYLTTEIKVAVSTLITTTPPYESGSLYEVDEVVSVRTARMGS